MDDQDLLRYSRHILLAGIGIEGQAKLRAAHALVIGAGGLGCPAALYLAASGIGRLTIADPDRVDLTNLQRQILYRAASVGAPKAVEATRALAAVNPRVELHAIEARLEGEALETSVAAADLVLDCSDNFATRQAANRACVRLAKPLVSGAAIRFDGQLAVFDPRDPDSPCYACVFPEDTQAEDVACAVMGVLSPLAGAIGALQAAEAVKLITGAGRTLAGRFMVLDTLHGEVRLLRAPRDPACPVCSARPSA